METCWILSNITAGTSKQIEAIINNQEILSKLVTLCMQDHHDVQREAVWAICNSTKKATPQQISFLLENGLIELFDFFLDNKKSPNISSKIINVILEAILEVLRTGQEHFTSPTGENPLNNLIMEKGIVDKIEELQNHPNESIYKKCFKILTEFFEEEEIF